MHPLIAIAQLLLVVREIKGRKKLQKIVHILKDCGAPFHERFEYSFYGMYSQQIRTEIDALTEDDLVREDEFQAGANPAFSYSATPRLETLLTDMKMSDDPSWAQTARDLNKMEPQELECISTIRFLQGCGFKDEALRQRLGELKPHLKQLFDASLRAAIALPSFGK